MGTIHMVLDAADIDRILKKMTDAILAAHKNMDNFALIGIHTRGVYLAQRIRSRIKALTTAAVDTGTVDINLYRDDWTRIGAQPIVRKSEISFNIDEKQVVLVDDVLYTGRTVRAALDTLMDYGRPQAIRLAVLMDRGHRELPIAADFVGRTIPTGPDEDVQVRLQETDGEEGVWIAREDEA